MSGREIKMVVVVFEGLGDDDIGRSDAWQQRFAEPPAPSSTTSCLVKLQELILMFPVRPLRDDLGIDSRRLSVDKSACQENIVHFHK